MGENMTKTYKLGLRLVLIVLSLLVVGAGVTYWVYTENEEMGLKDRVMLAHCVKQCLGEDMSGLGDILARGQCLRECRELIDNGLYEEN